jgi:two-component system nitrogen regulation response regulator NtrX
MVMNPRKDPARAEARCYRPGRLSPVAAPAGFMYALTIMENSTEEKDLPEKTPAHGKVGESILVVDDEKNILRSLKMILDGEGYAISTATSGESALEMLSGGKEFDLAILDLKLPGIDGIETLKKIRSLKEQASIPILMISGHATLHDAVEAVKLGATDFFEKPLDRDRVLLAVRKVFEKNTILSELRTLRSILGKKYEIIGTSPVVKKILTEVEKVAPTKGRVLITGESGVGKEIVAWAVHRLSPRAEKNFVKVNCAAIPSELIESELFGYEKGAFTGAAGSKKGQFELASGGTLFLDEIGDMSLSAQAKVLRALQSGEITRIGGEAIKNVDVRVIAATNHDLKKDVEAGKFREDLYFRLDVIRINVPPLRERTGDIPALVDHFVREFCRENNFRVKEVTPEAMGKLTAYAWPGNVRELKNVVERMVIMSGEVITGSDVPVLETSKFKEEEIDLGRKDMTLKEFREEMEKRFIVKKLQETHWNISQTAQALGIERTNLHKKLKQLGVSREEP